MNDLLKREIDFQQLDETELISINGGGLVEDMGYYSHKAYDKVCCAGNWVYEQACDAVDAVQSWWDSW